MSRLRLRRANNVSGRSYWGIARTAQKAISYHLMEKMAGAWLSGIVAATPVIAQRFPQRKTVMVQNFPIINELNTMSPVPYKMRAPAFAYVGGIAVIRGIREMIQAIAQVQDPSATLKLAGEFAPADLKDKVRSLPGWERTESLGWQSRKQVADMLGRARAGLVLFHPEPNHVASQPNKLFEYMSTGLPVIASDFPLWREIITKSNCGLLVDPKNPKAIAGAMDWVLGHPDEADRMGQNGRDAVGQRYNWVSESARLISFYEHLFPFDNATR